MDPLDIFKNIPKEIGDVFVSIRNEFDKKLQDLEARVQLDAQILALKIVADLSQKTIVEAQAEIAVLEAQKLALTSGTT